MSASAEHDYTVIMLSTSQIQMPCKTVELYRIQSFILAEVCPYSIVLYIILTK